MTMLHNYIVTTLDPLNYLIVVFMDKSCGTLFLIVKIVAKKGQE